MMTMNKPSNARVRLVCTQTPGPIYIFKYLVTVEHVFFSFCVCIFIEKMFFNTAAVLSNLLQG